MENDKFNGVTNGEFIDYFKIDLHSRMEIINYTYPHELLDEDGGFGEHVHRCTALLKDYILLCFRNAEAAAVQKQKDALENTGTAGQQEELNHTGTVQQTPGQRSERLEMQRKEENEQSALKYIELRDEIDRLIDEHRERVKIIYIDL